MLTSRYARLSVTVAAAAALTISLPQSAHAGTIDFYLTYSNSGPYSAVHDNTGSLLYTFTNNQTFAVQIDQMTLGTSPYDNNGVGVPYCNSGDCSQANPTSGDYVTNIAFDTGTTCGINGFLKPNNSCSIEAGFSLRDDRIPDPNVDYGLWTIWAELNVHKAGTTVGGQGYLAGRGDSPGQVYVLDKGASTPEPSPFLLVLIGAGALTLSRVPGIFRLRLSQRG